MPDNKKMASDNSSFSNPNIETEEERLRRNIFLPDMEKLKLFTKMLRTNALLKKAKITHK